MPDAAVEKGGTDPSPRADCEQQRQVVLRGGMRSAAVGRVLNRTQKAISIARQHGAART